MIPVDRSVLLAFFSRRNIGAGTEEMLDYGLTQDVIRLLIESLPDSTRRDRLGEEGFREIAITLIIKIPIFWFGLFGQSLINTPQQSAKDFKSFAGIRFWILLLHLAAGSKALSKSRDTKTITV